MAFDDSVKLIWSLSASALGTTISAAGNSGTWPTIQPQPIRNAVTPVDLRRADDMWLSVIAAGGAGTSLKVQLNFYDDLGNLFQFSTGTTPLFGVTVAAAPGQAIVFAGRHGAAGGSYLVASEWGQVAWSATAYPFTGVEIALYGR